MHDCGILNVVIIWNRYIQNHRLGFYTRILLPEKLHTHLMEVG